MIEKPSFFRETKKMAVFAVSFLMVLCLLLDLFFIHSAHPVFFWHSLPGAYLLLGFFGALALAATLKIAGTVLYRPENKEPSE